MIGQHYNQAMQAFPQARDQEFNLLLKTVEWHKVKKVLDIPAGGGYLRRFLPEIIELVEVYPSEGFLAANAKISRLGPQIEFGDNSFDCITCLAALHHIKQKQLFVLECLRVLRAGGIFRNGDVMKGSPEADFLETTVNRYSSTGQREHTSMIK